MNHSTVDSNLAPLRILPLRFVLRSSGMNFPEFSGSVWHGGLACCSTNSHRMPFAVYRDVKYNLWLHDTE